MPDINATIRMIRTPWTPVTIAGLGESRASIISTFMCSSDIVFIDELRLLLRITRKAQYPT
jgi:hypothetical protein